MKNALPKVTSEEIKGYVQTGKLTVDGIELVEGDLTVQRYIELPEAAEKEAQFATHTDNDVVVRLDILVHPELQGEWLARELINRVQKLRKAAGLQATDDIDIFYKFEEGSGAELLDALKEHGETVQKTVRGLPREVSHLKPSQKVLIAQEQEVADVKFVLTLAQL